MDPDDLEELLEGRRPDLEARFRELEDEDELDRLRRAAGMPPRSTAPGSETGETAEDPLADLKARVEGAARPGAAETGQTHRAETAGEGERFLRVVCPHCGAHNRMSLVRVRTGEPVCGRCKERLATAR